MNTEGDAGASWLHLSLLSLQADSRSCLAWLTIVIPPELLTTLRRHILLYS